MTLAAEDIRFAYDGCFSLAVSRLCVAPGEVVAVVGRNGAGKSTLLRLLAGLLFPFEGRVSIDGRPLDPREPIPHRRRIGFVFARPVRFRGTALENAAAGLVAQGAGRKGALERARAWLERMGVAAKADAPATTLSDGELQRVAFARALAPEPDYVFLDEPFARFDPPTRAEWAAEVARLASAGERGILLVTQEPSEALRLARRIVILDHGRVVQEGLTEELRAAPATSQAGRMLGIEM